MRNELPKHVAIIMDGNRRWAKAQGLPFNKGHEAGVNALEIVVESAADFGVKYLTVYALSTENIKDRSSLELRFLFSLIKKGIAQKLQNLDKNGVSVKFFGDLSQLPVQIQNSLKEMERKLSKNKRLFLSIALNYGGRDEIINAVKKTKKPSDKITIKDIQNNLYTKDIPDPDIIIRTGGQMRLSNFLLWQSSYSELFFVAKMWPDFGRADLRRILDQYASRLRNFGS